VRLLVTGAGGGLARAFLARVPPHHDVRALTHAELDVGDLPAVMDAVAAIEPEAIVNLAGFTDVDGNERDPARAFRDNALGPHHVALAARAVGAVLLHVSTDYVFDGAATEPYDESARPAPINVYGRAKLLGEERVRTVLAEHVIVRVAYLYGTGADHLSRQLARLRAGESAAAIVDRTGSPTHVDHVAERLLPVLLSGRWGTYHLAGPEPASWYEALCRLRERGGFAAPVRPQRAEELDRPAARPRYSALTSVLLEHLDVAPMPSLDEGLDALLRAG
jgi:dTDP-4-dehydrorhamnose reductase